MFALEGNHLEMCHVVVNHTLKNVHWLVHLVKVTYLSNDIHLLVCLYNQNYLWRQPLTTRPCCNQICFDGNHWGLKLVCSQNDLRLQPLTVVSWRQNYFSEYNDWHVVKFRCKDNQWMYVLLWLFFIQFTEWYFLAVFKITHGDNHELMRFV